MITLLDIWIFKTKCFARNKNVYCVSINRIMVNSCPSNHSLNTTPTHYSVMHQHQYTHRVISTIVGVSSSPLNGDRCADIVLTNILLTVDAGDLSALVLLDLSAAFDAVDHGILLHRLNSAYQIVGSVQQWFQSYLPRARASRIFFLITRLHGVWCTACRAPSLVPYFPFCTAATCS